MANREKGFGMTAEMAARMASKYSMEDEAKVVDWISKITGLPKPPPNRENVHAWLKDGKVLIKLMNTMSPGAIPKHNEKATMAFKAMENISFFTQACEKQGVQKMDLFQTVDLFEDQNMAQVLVTLVKLSGVMEKKGFKGPHIGVREADGNKRDFDEAKLREGRNVIGLQMGTNQVASQKGMTAYGLGRQVAP